MKMERKKMGCKATCRIERAASRATQGQFTTSVLIKQKATPYTKLIREWLSCPPRARSSLQKYFPAACLLVLRAFFLRLLLFLIPSSATFAYRPRCYYHFFTPFPSYLLHSPLLSQAVFETLRMPVSVFVYVSTGTVTRVINKSID